MKKRYKDMTDEEKVKYNYEAANRSNKIAAGIWIATALVWIIAYLDEIVSFVRYVLSYLH